MLGVAARRGVPVAYVPGLVMRRAADLYPGESKTDRRDAFVLADTGRTRRHQVHWLDAGNDELLEQLRVLNGYDIDLAADGTRLTNRLRDALTGLSPALERVLGPNLHYPGARDLLARYPTPQALAPAGRGRIARTIRKRSPRVAKALTEAVAEALDAQTVVVPGSVAMGRVIAEVATELERTQQRRERLGAEIGELFQAHPFGRVLGSLPGVGPRTGARMLAEIGDISRFADGSRLASYARLAPVTRQSGNSIRGQTRSRRGNHRLKNAMYLSAFASLRDPASRAFYDRKRAEGKKHTAAVIEAEALRPGVEAVAPQDAPDAVVGEANASPLGTRQLGGDALRSEAGVPQCEGDDALLDDRAGGVGEAWRAALPGPEHLETVALGLLLPAVERGMVDAHRPAGGTDAAELLGEGDRTLAKAIQLVVRGHGGLLAVPLHTAG